MVFTGIPECRDYLNGRIFYLPRFRIQTIADITDDKDGSVPCNLGDGTMQDPVYGVNKQSRKRTAPYMEDSIDMMAVGNLPNELAPRCFPLFRGAIDQICTGRSF